MLSNICCFALSLHLGYFFGNHYRQLRLTGKYSVGHTTFYSQKYGNWVSVYYPASEMKSSGSEFKLHLDYKDQEGFLESQERCFQWMFRTPR